MQTSDSNFIKALCSGLHLWSVSAAVSRKLQAYLRLSIAILLCVVYCAFMLFKASTNPFIRCLFLARWIFFIFHVNV